MNSSFGLISKKRTKEEENEFQNFLFNERERNKTTTISKEQEMESLLSSNSFIVELNKKKKRSYHSIAKWSYPKVYLKIKEELINKIRDYYNIKIKGENVLSPIDSFRAMKIPNVLIKALGKIGVTTPTPIQMQTIPYILQGRDVIAISRPGTGKSYLFIIPLILQSIYEELRIPLKSFQGPFSLILVPNRELAIQTYDKIMDLLKELVKTYPMIRVVLCIGGVDIKSQIEEIDKGIHIIVGTPGRLSDLISKNKVNTKYIDTIVFDEADRVFDQGFDIEIGKILEKFDVIRQVILLSSTLPNKIQEYISRSLYKPIEVNIDTQLKLDSYLKYDFEIIKDESRLINLLKTLQKTPPPVIIFCENKPDVDLIHEYLLLKGIDVCSIHSEREQYERNLSLRQLREGTKDILVCTDIVSKGVDFIGIQHIINYEMTKDIETFILRSGRCSRGLKKKGIITTYITKSISEGIIFDLKNLFTLSKLPIPDILLLMSDKEVNLNNQCSFCGVIGHLLEQCQKYESQKSKMIVNKLKIQAFKGNN